MSCPRRARNPRNLPGGDRLAFWFSAKLGKTIVSAKVSAWADQSGHGYAVAQATVGNRPPVVSAGLNGRDGIRGDGLTVDLNNSSGLAAAFIGGSDLPHEVMYVGQWITANAADNSCAVGFGSSTVANHFLQCGATTSGNNKWRYAIHDGTTLRDRSGGTFDTTARLFNHHSSGTVGALALNETPVTLDSSGNLDTGSITSIDRFSLLSVYQNGAQTRNANMDLYDAAGWFAELTAAERGYQARYFRNEYAL